MTKTELIKIANIFGFELTFDEFKRERNNSPLDMVIFHYIYDKNTSLTIYSSELSFPKDQIYKKFRKTLILKGRNDLSREFKQLFNIDRYE